MTPFEWLVAGALVMIVLSLMVIADAVGKYTRHLSNMADRLLDIDNTLNKR